MSRDVVVRCTTWSSRTPEELWQRALDVGRQEASLAPWGERLEDTTAAPGAPLRLGDEATFSASHLGVRWRLTTRVVAGEHPSWFRDEQTVGPFARWQHTHRVRPDGDGSRLVHEVRYRAPAVVHLLGLDRLWLRRRVIALLCRRVADIATAPGVRPQVMVELAPRGARRSEAPAGAPATEPEHEER